MEGGTPDRRPYRIVKAIRPTEEDFKSHAAMGKIPPRAIRDDAERLRSWQRVSVFDSEAGARRVALASKDMRLGAFIAELLTPSEDQSTVLVEKTQGSHGHYDIAAYPATLLALVMRVVPV